MDGRAVTVVLIGRDGHALGALDPVEIESPWWQDAASVVAAVRARHGIDVTILRLLEAERPAPPGGAVTYAAEAAGSIPGAVRPWSGEVGDHPLRMAWARPGGPAAHLTWAASALTDRRMAPVGPAEQVRTWNLSSLWRIPVAGQTVWLKAVPPFFAHEGRVIDALAGWPVPSVLARSDDGVALLAATLGEDLYQAPRARLLEMVDVLISLQGAWVDRTDELLSLGLPDWRGPALAAAIDDTIARTAGELAPAEVDALGRFAASLPDRLAAVAACGIPDSLVHGDFYPGNFRGDESSLVLHDWGDCGVGHPLLDESAFLDRIPADDVPAVRAHWQLAWRAALPGCDPYRAATLLAPVAAARQAVLYRGFLDRIEPSEHPYHRDDPASWLRRVTALV